jgi:tyrosyl-tRNA synthetase
VTRLTEDLEFRGLVHQVTDPEVLTRLDVGELTVYAGFDPTAPSLHVGSLLQLCTLRRFQEAGNRTIVLAGGGTGLIGDPGGKSDERPLVEPETIEAYLRGIRPQLEQFLRFDQDARGSRALLRNNAEWLVSADLLGFLRDVGKHFTVNQMINKESVRSRIGRPEQGISYTEFSYMLLQAYDFLKLFEENGCTTQLGGSDQWGNITMGVELIGKVHGRPAYGITTPLVTKADGSKFGKTESGTVWLDAARTSPYELYQFFVRCEDDVVGTYLRYFTFLSHEEITALDAETASHPHRRAAQRALAAAVCDLVHGPDERARAEAASGALFSEEISSLDEALLLDLFKEAPSSEMARSALTAHATTVVDALEFSGLCASRGEARRAIGQGGIYLNNQRVDDEGRVLGSDDLLHDRYFVLRKGRRDYHLVRII